METKKCTKCKINKSFDKFHKNNRYKDNLTTWCKQCFKEHQAHNLAKKRQDPEWVEKERKRDRDRNRVKKVNKNQQLNSKRYFNKYPEKKKARIKSQKMKPKTKGNQLHHWSYNEEHYKDVIELTRKDHMKAHRFLIYDQERMMYRGLDGVLLDTKLRHLNYILDVIENKED